MRETMESLTGQWSRLGAMFGTPPVRFTPDLEKLLIGTARFATKNVRLFIMAASWLATYGEYVAKRRLAVMVQEELEPEFRPVMGMMLDWVRTKQLRHRKRFDEIIRLCQHAKEPRPLSDFSASNRAMREVAHAEASALSKRWGLWFDDFEIKANAIRPAEWVAKHNPTLWVRALCGGDLVATIAADAIAGMDAFASESALARRYGASRASVREALRKLTLAGYAVQFTRGRSRAIEVEI